MRETYLRIFASVADACAHTERQPSSASRQCPAPSRSNVCSTLRRTEQRPVNHDQQANAVTAPLILHRLLTLFTIRCVRSISCARQCHCWYADTSWWLCMRISKRLMRAFWSTLSARKLSHASNDWASKRFIRRLPTF